MPIIEFFNVQRVFFFIIIKKINISIDKGEKCIIKIISSNIQSLCHPSSYTIVIYTMLFLSIQQMSFMLLHEAES